MKYKILALILSMLLLLSFTSCADDDETTTTEKGSDITTTAENNGTNPSQPLGTRYNYSDLNKYVTVPNYVGHKFEISGDFVQNTIDSYLLQYANELYRAERGDDIYVNLKFTEVIYLDEAETINTRGDVITELGRTNLFIDGLGDGSYNKTLEELIIEWEIQITKSTEKIIILPNDAMFGEYAGRKLYFSCEFVDKECERGDVVSVSYTGYYTDASGNIKLNEIGEKDYFDFGTDVKFYLGSHLAIEDFENGIIGMRLGEANKKQITATFPADYSVENLRGQKAIFEVKVEKIYVCPKYDNTFAKLLGYDTVEKLEEDILASFAESEIQYWLTENTVYLSYPEKEYNELVEEFNELDTVYQENYGMSFESFVEMYYDMTKDEYIKETMKNDLLYYGIAQKRNIVPTQAQLNDVKESLIDEYTEEFLNNYLSITEAEARQMAIDFVNNEMGDAGIYDEAIYTLVTADIKANCTVEVTEPTYESVTNRK